MKLEALEAFGEDPRIAAHLADYLTHSSDWLPTSPVGTAIFKVLARHGHARTLDVLRSSPFNDPRAHDQAWRQRKLEALAKAVAKHRTTPLGDRARATLDQVRALPAGPSPGEVNFVAAADPATRAVATDQLLEQGGPRGEFVVLQQAKKVRALTAAEKKREEALLAAHRKKWMGGVAKILDPAKSRFEDGVLVGGEVESGMDELSAVLDAPEWATVRFVESSWELDLRLFRRWPGITSVRVTSLSHLLTLTDADPPLAIRELTYAGPNQQPTVVEREALMVARGLPALTHLSISGYWHKPSNLGYLVEGPLARRLERLVYTRRYAIAEWVALLDGAPPNLRVGSIGYDGRGACLDFTRDAAGRFTQLVVNFETPREDVRRNFDRMLEALALVPAGLLTSVQLDPRLDAPTKAHRARLEEVVAGLVRSR
ncbi:MAG: hypothetical protein IPJ34_38235 [Myxococcales bacterium]|nr:hypothetical protein [Myxococcales bacterium]